ncbi:HlyU family transcriptional regulator [Balneatrix alpica]|uniref:HlyU family transcriptional regulator n=1 Tax=Balneatrix alpica TaxID=75684 RepID=A0ABV5ZAK5_9GAMM|nr:HlyU family transcriptional regulator [Balneatrix alpica]
MGILDSLKNLFSASQGPDNRYPVEEYQGYQIQPQPQAMGGQYRVQALIRKGEQEHLFIRSDLVGGADECAELTLRKAKMTIDQLGERIFA